MILYSIFTPERLARTAAYLQEIGQSRPMMEKTMEYKNNITRDMDQIGFGREMARQTTDRTPFPVVEGISETLGKLADQLVRCNSALDQIADRVSGAVPECGDMAEPFFGTNLADRVRAIEIAANRYESLLNRF